MNKLRNVHLGDILKEDFLDEMKISSRSLAKAIRMNHAEVCQIINGTLTVSVDIALRLGKYFDVSPEFWLNTQAGYDLQRELD